MYHQLSIYKSGDDSHCQVHLQEHQSMLVADIQGVTVEYHPICPLTWMYLSGKASVEVD